MCIVIKFKKKKSTKRNFFHESVNAYNRCQFAERDLNVNNPVVNSFSKSLIKVVSWGTAIQTNCTRHVNMLCKQTNFNFSTILCKHITKKKKNSNAGYKEHNHLSSLWMWWSETAKIPYQLLSIPHSPPEWLEQNFLLLLAIAAHILEYLTIVWFLHSPFTKENDKPMHKNKENRVPYIYKCINMAYD